MTLKVSTMGNVSWNGSESSVTQAESRWLFLRDVVEKLPPLFKEKVGSRLLQSFFQLLEPITKTQVI